jgi:indole-3-glycerol phosphate synthase
MNVLEQIIQNKKVEVEQLRRSFPVKVLEQRDAFSSRCLSLKEYVRHPDKTGIIAEFKRMSPSKGVINGSASVRETTVGYVTAGASALSVLTDWKFFGGTNDDLIAARALNNCPILRKDFTIDEYQIVEAKSIGADAILLIAAVLSPRQVKEFTDTAHSLGMEVLLEVHDELEWQQNQDARVDLVGVNNRNLKTFEVSLDISKRVAGEIPDSFVKVSESGISTIEAITELKKFGYEGFLIGENFMKSSSPSHEAMRFMEALRDAVE